MAMPRSYAGSERLDWFRRDGEGRGAPGQLHHFAERRDTRASGRSDGDNLCTCTFKAHRHKPSDCKLKLSILFVLPAPHWLSPHSISIPIGQENAFIKNAIVGWNAVVGSWARIEGREMDDG